MISVVLREGLRLVERREAEDKARLKNLREAARLGIADIEAGRFRDFGSGAEMQEHLGALAHKAVGDVLRLLHDSMDLPRHFDVSDE
jgi:antitoxin ParD1/3/4